MMYLKQREIDPQYICHYCKKKFRNGQMPAYCVMNNLFVGDTPEVISSLNAYGKMFIQRAKAFQTVAKMRTVMNKKIPQRQMIQKVKGRTFHLPLPLQETLNKLCCDTDAINTNQEIYILVRGVPTTSKIIWEEMVDVKRVFNALTWLKHNNSLYSQITLPSTYEKLCFKKLNFLAFKLQEHVENDTESVVDDEKNLLNNSESLMQEIKNPVEVALNHQRKAMLTQKDDNDSYYEQYTIYPLYEKKIKQNYICIISNVQKFKNYR